MENLLDIPFIIELLIGRGGRVVASDAGFLARSGDKTGFFGFVGIDHGAVAGIVFSGTMTGFALDPIGFSK
jgi:hypothetical protein